MHDPRRQSSWERIVWWRSRTCGVCGLRWPCDESKRERVRAQFAPTDHTGAWRRQQTAAWPQIRRASALTPAQEHRAKGGDG
jgi:hypothetical protein